MLATRVDYVWNDPGVPAILNLRKEGDDRWSLEDLKTIDSFTIGHLHRDGDDGYWED